MSEFLDGCLDATDEDFELVAEMNASAISFPTIYKSGDMPVLSWDSDFQSFIDRRGNNIETMMREKTRCLFPWRVLANIPPDQLGRIIKLYFSQRTKPSCSGHANNAAQESSVLSCIGLGVPFIYESYNPYPLWWLSKNKSERGGQSVAKMAKAANEIGHFVMSEVGEDNTKISDSFKQNIDRFLVNAKRNQSAILFLTSETAAGLAAQIFELCRAGLGVVVGNGTAVNGSTVDKNNVQVATLGGSWKHATSFNTWMSYKGTQYVYWTNSHGGKYTKSTMGEPFDGCWMPMETVVKFMGTSFRYGKPYCVIPEAVWQDVRGINYDYEIPFPSNF
jgi:hypothetical protein